MRFPVDSTVYHRQNRLVKGTVHDGGHEYCLVNWHLIVPTDQDTNYPPTVVMHSELMTPEEHAMRTLAQ